jgi:hypothetical protein
MMAGQILPDVPGVQGAVQVKERRDHASPSIGDYPHLARPPT